MMLLYFDRGRTCTAIVSASHMDSITDYVIELCMLIPSQFGTRLATILRRVVQALHTRKQPENDGKAKSFFYLLYDACCSPSKATVSLL